MITRISRWGDRVSRRQESCRVLTFGMEHDSKEVLFKWRLPDNKGPYLYEYRTSVGLCPTKPATESECYQTKKPAFAKATAGGVGTIPLWAGRPSRRPAGCATGTTITR